MGKGREEEERGCALALESPVADRLVEALSLSAPPTLAKHGALHGTAENQSLENPRHVPVSVQRCLPHSGALCKSTPTTPPSSPTLLKSLPLPSNAEQMQCLLRNVRLQSPSAFITWARRQGVLIHQIWFKSYSLMHE